MVEVVYKLNFQKSNGQSNRPKVYEGRKQISMYKIPPLQIMPPSSPPPFFTIRGQNPLSNYEVLKEMEVNATGNIREATGR